MERREEDPEPSPQQRKMISGEGRGEGRPGKGTPGGTTFCIHKTKKKNQKKIRVSNPACGVHRFRVVALCIGHLGTEKRQGAFLMPRLPLGHTKNP